MDIATYLAEKDRIHDRIVALFVATDMRDWPQVEACFTPTVQFNMLSIGGENTSTTPREITAGWDAGLKGLQAVHHQIGNLQTTVEGDTAKSTCYGIAYHYLPTKSGQNTRLFVGNYELSLEKREDDWAISAFTFNLTFIQGNTELEKDAVGSPAAQ